MHVGYFSVFSKALFELNLVQFTKYRSVSIQSVMSRASVLKPAKLEIDVNSDSAAKLWNQRNRTFDNLANELDRERGEDEAAVNRLQLLTNYLSADIFELIEDCESFDNAVQILIKFICTKTK